MNITDPVHQKDLDDALTQYKVACKKFETARDVAYQQKENVARLRRSAEEAESDAKKARETCIALMRDPGTPSEKLRELRSIERSSYSIAEDYRILADDQRWDAEDAEIEAARLLESIKSTRSPVFSLYADIHLDAALKKLDTLLRAIWLYSCVHGEKAAVEKILHSVKGMYHASDLSFADDEVVKALAPPAGMRDFDARKWTPTTLHRRHLEREKYDAARQEKAA
ncbi:MAG: hypothetical protein E2602_08285 [Achromobacter sp.]|nr:hypothetical protein [Achromobacter sp.]